MPNSSVLPAVWDVPEVFCKRLGRQAGRQRAMFADGHALLVLHAPPGPDDDERIGRFFWRLPDGSWRSDNLGAGGGALHKHLDEYQSLIDRLDDQEQIATSAAQYFEVIRGISPVLRASRNLHQVLQTVREEICEDPEIINFRDRAYQIERTAELLVGDAKNALDFAIAQQAEEQAETSHRMAVASHRLNVLAAFFFPLATVSTVFGMNLLHGMEDEPPPATFLFVLGLGLLCGFVLKWFVTRDSPRQ